jgi:hypothetical protein
MFDAAWKHYLDTGENLGKFDSFADADAYAQQLHNRGNKPAPLAADGKTLVVRNGQWTPVQAH